MQPGQLISPGNDGPSPQNDQLPTTAAQPPVVPAQELPAQPPAPKEEPTPFVIENGDIAPVSNNEQVELSWTASEFIEHQKPQGWYLSLTAAALVVAAAMYFVLRDIVTTVVIVIAAVLFGVVGARKPRATNYSLSRTGLRIGDKAYPYSAFKSFSVLEEGAINSIQLLPLKRLMPPISLYFPPEMEEQIGDLLSDYLPHEDRDHDAIDRLMKRMHF